MNGELLLDTQEVRKEYQMLKNLGIKASGKHFADFCFLSSDEESHALTKHKSTRHYSVTCICHCSEHRAGLELGLAPLDALPSATAKNAKKLILLEERTYISQRKNAFPNWIISPL